MCRLLVFIAAGLFISELQISVTLAASLQRRNYRLTNLYHRLGLRPPVEKWMAKDSEGKHCVPQGKSCYLSHGADPCCEGFKCRVYSGLAMRPLHICQPRSIGKVDFMTVVENIRNFLAHV